jgi:drug/metabolite transporter (DMT)-like permease
VIHTATLLGAVSVADYRGELAALATAGCWTVSALAFTAAANRFGSLALNIIRLAMALIFFAILGWAARGLPWPTDATAHNWFWLGLSGLVGFTLGDLCLFRAFVLMGPRLTMLVMSLVPMIAALIAWAALGEGMTARGIGGMALTISGVAWVVLERRPAELSGATHASAYAVVLALGAAAGQAGGLVLSKIGMEGYDPFPSTQIRTIAGLAGFVVLFFFLRAWLRLASAVRNRAGMGYAALGACFGPFLGVSLSLMAVRYAPVGVAATIMSILPVLIIPFMIVIYKERVSLRAAAGAALAVAGVALLFL